MTPVKRKRVEPEVEEDRVLFGGWGAPFRPDGTRREPLPPSPGLNRPPGSSRITGGRHASFKIHLPSHPDPPILPPTRTTRSVSQKIKASGTVQSAPEIPLPALFPFTPPPTNAVAGPSGTSSAPPVASP